MKYTNYQPTPVYASGGEPLMPCHPARARKLMRQGRAVPHHVRGMFGIRLLDKTRNECKVQDVSLNIDPGSDTSGFAIVIDGGEGRRVVVGSYELKHRAKSIRAKITRRAAHRRDRRHRLRHRESRYSNRHKRAGVLTPSIDSLRIDTMRLVGTIQQMYPIVSISIERNKFDTQLMQNPDIKGAEYQYGTLFGWHVRAYVLNRDNYECVYCGRRNTKLELDHIHPRIRGGSNRVDNLIASCKSCNKKKGDQHIEEFLDGQPDLLANIQARLRRSDLASATHINAALPFIIRDLQQLNLPLYLADAATVAWNRKQLDVPKTHCYDAALHGLSFTSIESLPSCIVQIMPSSGRSKQKSRMDRHGTPTGRSFREQQKLPRHLRVRNPAPGHSSRHQRYGPEMIATGDIAMFEHEGQSIIGRAIIQGRGAYIEINGHWARVNRCQLIARNPRYKFRRVAPSQQGHNRTGEVV